MKTILQKVHSEKIDHLVFETDDDTPDFIVESFVEWLSEYISAGAVFKDGQTLQYGFTLLKCRVDSRVLTLLAPDFTGFPINWVTNLGPAFRIVIAHKYTPETFDFTPEIPTLQSTAIVGRRFDQLPMFINRLQPGEANPNDSGWFLGSTGDDVDNNDPQQLKVISLYEAVLAAPHIVEFLSLPVDCQVFFDEQGSPCILWEYEELEIPEGSYLALRLSK